MSSNLPIVYSLLYQKRYFIQTVLVFSIIKIFLYKFTVFQTEAYLLQVFLYTINLLLGSFIVLLEGFVDKAATIILSPIQSYFRSKRLNISISVLAKIICFIIGYF